MAKTTRNADAFALAIERALEHAGDAAWLGAESPLAAPYFIGSFLNNTAEADTALGRGRALIDVLLSAAVSLSAGQTRLLNVSFFERRPTLNNTGVARALDMSEATYYRHRASAIDALATAVNQRLVPPLRHAVPQPRPIINREAVTADSLAALHQRHSVAITGAGGLGKTALGAYLAWQWPPERAFWFTVRPGLNDHLSSFVFSLGHFMRRHGATNTWRQLVADQGALDATRILGLIRHDLDTLSSSDAPVLLCVDEADLLRQELRGHAQVIHVLEELSESTPLLLMSQQPVTATHRHHVLGGLSPGDVAALLAREGVTDLSSHEQAQLCAATRGNPALILLFVTLHRAGDRLADVLPQLADTPSVEVLLNRIWKRLSDNERSLLAALAVFRSPAPLDDWSGQQDVVESLRSRDLVQLDGMSGITLPAYIREFVLRRTPVDERNLQHLKAGEIREARGEYTAAAYHYLAGRQPALAIWTWFSHRELETSRGHSPVARELFAEIASGELADDEDHRALALLQAEQSLLAGATDEADEALNAVTWPVTHPATPYARQIDGDIRQMQGRIDQALEAYRASLDMLSHPHERRIVQLRSRIGHIYVTRLRDLDQARREGALALWQAHIFQGYVEEESGSYPEARSHYEAAMMIASQLEDGRVVQSRTHSYLGHLSWREGDAEAAIQHLEEALREAQALGEPVSVIYNQLNLAGAYIVAGRYDEALTQAQAGLLLAEPMQHAFLVAGLTASAGEACFYLGRLDEAEHYASRSLREEEEVQRPYALTVLGWVRAAQGQAGEAESLLRSAIESAQEAQDRYAEAPAWKTLGRVLRNEGRREEAREAYKQARQLYTALQLSKDAEAIHVLIASLADGD